MLSRLNMIGKYSRVSKLLPIKRYQSNFSVDNISLPKIKKDEEILEEKNEKNEDLDMVHDRCMLTKDAKIKAVDIDGRQIEPIDINPWYEEDELEKENGAEKNQADSKINPLTSTVSDTK